MYSYERKAAPFALRAAVFAVSFVTSAALVAAVGSLFDQSSRGRVLRDTPQARAALARCGVPESRQERQACVRQVVARASDRDAGLTRVANVASGVASKVGADSR